MPIANLMFSLAKFLTDTNTSEMWPIKQISDNRCITKYKVLVAKSFSDTVRKKTLAVKNFGEFGKSSIIGEFGKSSIIRQSFFCQFCFSIFLLHR